MKDKDRCIYGYNYSNQSTPLIESGKDYTGFMTLATSSSRGIERLFLAESIRRDNERRDNERRISNLEESMRENKEQLDNLISSDNYQVKEEIKEIEKLIEIPPKQNCLIM